MTSTESDQDDPNVQRAQGPKHPDVPKIESEVETKQDDQVPGQDKIDAVVVHSETIKKTFSTESVETIQTLENEDKKSIQTDDFVASKAEKEEEEPLQLSTPMDEIQTETNQETIDQTSQIGRC